MYLSFSLLTQHRPSPRAIPGERRSSAAGQVLAAQRAALREPPPQATPSQKGCGNCPALRTILPMTAKWSILLRSTKSQTIFVACRNCSCTANISVRSPIWPYVVLLIGLGASVGVPIVKEHTVPVLITAALPPDKAVCLFPLRRRHAVEGAVRLALYGRQSSVWIFFHVSSVSLLPFSPKRLPAPFLRRVPNRGPRKVVRLCGERSRSGASELSPFGGSE